MWTWGLFCHSSVVFYSFLHVSYSFHSIQNVMGLHRSHSIFKNTKFDWFIWLYRRSLIVCCNWAWRHNTFDFCCVDKLLVCVMQNPLNFSKGLHHNFWTQNIFHFQCSKLIMYPIFDLKSKIWTFWRQG
jgi:hypothetical protein